MLYRSDQLNLLSDADLGVLDALNIRMFCDLRTDDERNSGADRLPPFARPLIVDVTGANPNSVLAGIMRDPGQLRAMGPEKAEKAMADVYRQLVTAKSAQEGYRTMFQRLADPAWLPGLFHCTAGKDRTGFASALLLTLLGVPWDTVMDDYLRTNDLWTGHIGRYLELDIDTRAAIVEARTPYLEAAFDVVAKDFGGPEVFAEKALGLDAKGREQLRADLLEG
jgi:protein-tyrosine phosphatase